jgi:hypothetical protein
MNHTKFAVRQLSIILGFILLVLTTCSVKTKEMKCKTFTEIYNHINRNITIIDSIDNGVFNNLYVEYRDEHYNEKQFHCFLKYNEFPMYAINGSNSEIKGIEILGSSDSNTLEIDSILIKEVVLAFISLNYKCLKVNNMEITLFPFNSSEYPILKKIKSKNKIVKNYALIKDDWYFK